MPELAALCLADPPELWAALGFAVDGGVCTVGGTALCLGAPGHGVTGWSLGPVDGLPTFDPPAPAGLADGPQPSGPQPDGPHPNGAVELDHLVVLTPDLARTIDACEEAGIALRRVAGAYAFFKLGPVVLEVVSPPDAQPGPARFWGLTFTVEDLDATAALLGDRLRPAKDAVQPGRRIATLDGSAGSSIPIAFMTPKP